MRLAVACAWLVGCARALPASDPHPDLGSVPVPVTATTLDGTAYELPARGHVTVVDLWATSCAPCLAALPDVERLAHRGVHVVGVASDDNPGLVAKAIAQSEVTYPNVVDADGEVRGWLHTRDVPTIVVFDRHGRIRWVHTGAPADVDGVVAALEQE